MNLIKCRCVVGDPIRGIKEGNIYFADMDSKQLIGDTIYVTLYPQSKTNKNLAMGVKICRFTLDKLEELT